MSDYMQMTLEQLQLSIITADQFCAMSTYLIVDSCLMVIHNPFCLLSLDRNSLEGEHLLIAARVKNYD